jgi:hypothetical protein
MPEKSVLKEYYMIQSSEKTSWSLKTSFWRKNCPINSKMVMKNYFHVRRAFNPV